MKCREKDEEKMKSWLILTAYSLLPALLVAAEEFPCPQLQSRGSLLFDEKWPRACDALLLGDTLAVGVWHSRDGRMNFSAGVIFVDVSNPDNPVNLAQYYANEINPYAPDGAPIYSLAHKENALYLTSESGVEILDVSDPASPRCVQIYNSNDRSMSGGRMIVNGDYALLAPHTVQPEGIEILDIHSPFAPVRIGFAALGKFVFQVLWDGGAYAYILIGNRDIGGDMYYTEKHQLVVLDLTDKQQPRIASKLPIEGTWGINKMGEFIYASAPIASQNQIIHRIDVSDPEHPRIVETLSVDYAPAQLTSIGDFYAGDDLYDGGIDICQIKEGFPLLIQRAFPAQGFQTVSCYGQYIYALHNLYSSYSLESQLQLQIYKLTDVSAIKGFTDLR